MNILKNIIESSSISNMQKCPDEKEEHELDSEDRIYLLNKELNHKILNGTYEHFLNSKKSMECNDVIDVNSYVYNDIEFFQDHYLDEDKSLFQKFNHCHTHIGQLMLKNVFMKPVYNIELLRKRQDLVQKMMVVSKQIKPYLEKIKEIEKDIVWFWDANNIKHMESMNDMVYFNYGFLPFFDINQILNSSQRALLVSNIYKIIISPLLTILTPLLSLIIPIIMILYFNKTSNLNISYGQIIYMYFKSIFQSNIFGMVIKNPTQAFMASLFTKGLYIFMYFQNIYYSFQSSTHTHKIINLVHDKMNKVSTYIEQTRKIMNVWKEDLSPFLCDFPIMENLSSYEEYLYDSLFQTKPQLFTHKGKILTTYQQFKMTKDKMIPLFYYVGAMDCIYSIQHLLSNSSSENPYCFTEFKEDVNPCIQIKNLWHPYLTNSETIKNNIDMKSNILITGPNAAGKSTFIKSMIINIILSQTVGISSSTNMILSPFHLLETYLHIPDTKGSSSLFEAEMMRSKEYIEKIKNLDASKKSFIVFDEIFSSTNYVEGFSGAYSILKRLSTFSNTLFITTTHYTDLEVLEKDTQNRIMNYKFEVIFDKDNNIIFNYKLKRGFSNQYIALELLRKNDFDEDIIKDALEMCSRIYKKKFLFHSSTKKNKGTKKLKSKKDSD